MNAYRKKSPRFLTACPKFEQLQWIAAVLHGLIVAEGEVVLGVTVHLSQQAEGGVTELLWQEHSGRHGVRPQAHFHPGSGGEHHRHIGSCRRKHKHT